MQCGGYWETQEKRGHPFSPVLLIYAQFSISLPYHKNLIASVWCNHTHKTYKNQNNERPTMLLSQGSYKYLIFTLFKATFYLVCSSNELVSPSKEVSQRLL